MQRRIANSPKSAQPSGSVDDELQRVAERYAVAITPSIESIIDTASPGDPIARQYLPDVRELEQYPDYRIWAYRRAAWTVDESPESIAEIHASRGEAGLRALPNIGKSLGARIARWLLEE